MSPVRLAGSPPMEAELTLTRDYPAPPGLVFRAWTDPAMLAQWWGPQGFTNPVCEFDARVGGKLRIVMRSPDGHDYPMQGVIQEFIPGARLSFSNSAVDATGKLLLDGVTTVSFKAESGGTRVTVHSRMRGLVPEAPQMLAGMEAGWSGSLDKLDTYLREQGR